MIENKTTSDCTIYAFVGTAILAISLVEIGRAHV